MDETIGVRRGLTLLGIWNILPIGIWTWFNDLAVEQLTRLTGRSLGTFCYIENDLDYECFIKEDTDLLKADLDALSLVEQKAYVQKIVDDYYSLVPKLEAVLTHSEALDFSKLSAEELALCIDELGQAWSVVTMQIWYAVLLDIWYPKPDDKAGLKTVIAKARDHCGHLHARSDKIEHDLHMEAGRRLGLSEREVYFSFQPELMAALRGTLVSREELVARMEKWVATNTSGRFEAYSGDAALRVMEQFSVPKVGEKKEGILKGTPASLGNVEGIAHVILLDKEFSEFKDGEILVSLQTMVHYLPIMKKASAILTEFGGLTSHAAIVSRELKKPAVVGISGLINSIKTGDRLEVNAKEGTVRIIG